MDFETVIKERCSVRHFSDSLVDNNYIDKMINAAILAPTAKNKQCFRLYIVKSKEGLAKIDSVSKCRYNAPYVAIFTYREDEMFVNEEIAEINSGIQDATIVATHFMLEATNLGIDTCWINLFNNYELEKAFDFDSIEHSVLIMPFGYRLDGVNPSKLHNLRKSKEELVKEL